MNFPDSAECSFALDEIELFYFFILLVRKYDPDIFIGYEVQKMSLGYLIKRGNELCKNTIFFRPLKSTCLILPYVIMLFIK